MLEKVQAKRCEMKNNDQNIVLNNKIASIPEDKLEYAISLQQQWRFEEAKSQYLALLKECPDDADALHNLGVLFSVQLLEPAEALPYFEAALNLDPTRLQFWFSYLDALIKAGALDVAEHVLILASNYGLNDLQIASFTRDIRLERTTIADLVDAVLTDATPLPEPQPLEAQPMRGAEPSMQDLQQLLSVFNQKKYEPTLNAITAMLQRFPQAVVVWTMLAETEKRQGFLEKALEARRQVATLQPSSVASQLALVDALLDLNRWDEAEAVLEVILRIHPSNAQALGKMGLIYQKQGKADKALHSYAWALRSEGLSPMLLEKFGSLLRSEGNQDGALVCFKWAVEASPNVPELLDAYGITLRNQDRLAAAENAFRSALKIHPGYTPALRSLCHLLEFHGRFAEAEAGLLRCTEIDNGSPETLFDVGRNLVYQKRENEAVDWLRRAIKIKPDFVPAHIMLSAALNSTEEPSVAMEEVKASIAVLPNVPQLHTNLGVINLSLSRIDDAIVCFRQALAVDPDFDFARSCLLFALSHSTKITPEELYREHRLYGRLIEEGVKGRQFSSYSNTRIPERALKVGFVSADFRNHAVAQFVIPFFQSLAEHSEIISYAYVNHGARDGATLKIQKNINVWRSVVKWSDDRLVEKIREDGIDILVDVSGHTAGNRLSVFARHPAPVQITWLGYPGTTGLKGMDYKLVNALYLKPDGKVDLQSQFTEKLALLPSSFSFKESDEKVDTGDAPFIKNGYLTFGSFNRLNKISHEVVVSWCQLLKALPDSRLIMGAMPANGVPSEVVEWFDNEGIASERVIFFPRTSLSDYLKLHAQVDLCLDTFPYTGGTTTLHALWMGVPTLTIVGDTYPGRQSSAILHSVGIESMCVARSVPELVDLARVWATQPQTLNKVRRALQSVYFSQEQMAEPAAVVQSTIFAMRQMWIRWCMGKKPKSFQVKYEDIGLTCPESILKR